MYRIRFAALAATFVFGLLGGAVPTAAQAAGLWFTCFTRDTGSVRCWGYNQFNQLGTAAPSVFESRAVAAVGLGRRVQIESGGYHACARNPLGRVHCWGLNNVGQLGTGSTGLISPPVRVVGVAEAVNIAVGHQHACAVRANGRVFCWGRNHEGQLGDGTREDRPRPVRMQGITDAVAVTASQRHTCVLHRTGEVSCTGYNASGQLGVPSTNTATGRYLSPVRVPGLRNVEQVVAGWDHTCAVNVYGNVLCWGNNLVGQLGRVTVNSAPNGPGRVVGVSRVAQIGLGRNQSCAINTNGVLFCWGDNSAGQLGNGQTGGHTHVPQRVRLPGAAALHILAGYDHTCVVRASRTIWCWGANMFGQLGNGTTQPSAVPVRAIGSGYGFFQPN